MHWSEEMVLNCKDDQLFVELISHEELLSGSRNVSVTVLKSHSSESGLLDLNSNALGQIEVKLNLLSWMDTWVGSGSENVEALVSSFVNHIN